MDTSLDKLRYPIGKFRMPEDTGAAEVDKWITGIESLPSAVTTVWNSFSEQQKDQSYRKDGWTGRQLVHHIADSHMNAYIRCKLALTENVPTIKPYEEAEWARLPDSLLCPPEVSIHLLTALHLRWSVLLRSLNTKDFQKKFYHPESKVEYTISSVLALYDWHGRHHLEHLKLIVNNSH